MSGQHSISPTQRDALMAAKTKRLFRTAQGWKGRGTTCFKNDTIRALVGRRLLEERNSPSLHLVLTSAGHILVDALANSSRRRAA